MGKIRLTKVGIYHYVRLIIRTIIFMVLLYHYVLHKVIDGVDIFTSSTIKEIAIIVIFIMFIIEMTLRFFPSVLESPGCQKQFKRNYIKTGKTNIVIEDNNGVVLVALVWIGLNAVLGLLHRFDVFDDGIMILISAFYSICDLICILLFCPFQTWFLHNKCCATCRIYNWDYAMMFTPLFFVRRAYSWSLLALSVALLVRWEITFYLHPERFSEKTNDYLRCANCTEKLCVHKRQLHTLWRHVEAYTTERVRRLRK